jgi:cell volume regulation protein A
VGIAVPALIIAAGLMVLARPIAVVVSLLPFSFPWREQLYIGWVGLRGAVPIVLALFPAMYGLDNARLYFNVAFFVVLVSLLLQGWTIAPAARWLQLEAPPQIEPVQRVTVDMPGHFEHEILGFEVKPGSMVAGRTLGDLVMPEGMKIMAAIRDGVPQDPAPGLDFRPGDFIYFLAQPQAIAHLGKLFDPHRVPDRLEEHRYFGDFVLNGDAMLEDLAAAYGLEAPEQAAGKSLADYLDRAFHGRAVVGDRVRIGAAELVVREIENGRISRVGLRLR